MKKIKKLTDIGTIQQAVFADNASVNRVAEAGLDLLPVGSLSNAVRIGEATPIMIFNSGGAVAYVAFGAQDMAAPSGPTNGIPVPAGQLLMLNSGASAWVRASAATVYGYKGDN